MNLVWEYVNPIVPGGRVKQGDPVPLVTFFPPAANMHTNFIFKARRYEPGYLQNVPRPGMGRYPWPVRPGQRDLVSEQPQRWLHPRSDRFFGRRGVPSDRWGLERRRCRYGRPVRQEDQHLVSEQ